MKFSWKKINRVDVIYVSFLSMMIGFGILTYTHSDNKNHNNRNGSFVVKKARYHTNINEFGKKESNLSIDYDIGSQSFEESNLTITHLNMLVNLDANNKETMSSDVYLKPQGKKDFLPSKDFALLIITLFSYLLIFTIVSILKRIKSNSGIEMYNNVLQKLENALELNIHDKDLKSAIKELKEAYLFDKDSGYTPSVQKLSDLYRTTFIKVKEELSKLDEDVVKEKEFIEDQLSGIEKMLKVENSRFLKILNDVEHKDNPKEFEKVWDSTKKYKKYKKILQYDVNSSLEIPQASLNQVLALYKELEEEVKDTKHKEYLKSSIEKIKRKIKVHEKESSKVKDVGNIQDIQDVFSAYDIVLNGDKNLLKLIEHDKLIKKTWSIILEVIEEKAHHSLLSNFKNNDLRLRPYSIKSLRYSLKEIVSESKILNIYYKIYNILLPLKESRLENMTRKVDDKLLDFVRNRIEELQQHRYTTILYFLKRYFFYFLSFSIVLLFLLVGISYCIYEKFSLWNNELFLMNTLFLLTFFIVFIVFFTYFKFKKWVNPKFSLYKNKIGQYINNISMLFVAISTVLYLDVLSEKFLLESHDKLDLQRSSIYGDILEKIGQLLFPSSFSDLHINYDLTPMEILVYKVIFLLLLGYLIFSMINFLIHKYDALYFSKQKKTLIPPELALISINFLLGILFLGLLYGTYMHYLDALHYVDVYNGGAVNELVSSGNEESSSNYIPFSIFIAVVGGLLTMATKDLLENYFSGISLQMDSPYEEHDRITINDSDMLEVSHIGIRADKFYDIKSNAILVIPHKKLIDETIVNFTLPTLDYRHQLTIYIPHIDYMTDADERSLPKRAEMLLLLSIFVNTGVKIPSFIIGTDDLLGELNQSIKENLDKYRKFIDKLLKKDKNNNEDVRKHIVEEKLREKSDVQKKYVNDIWKELESIYQQEEDDFIDNPLKKLFIFKLIKAIEEAESDQDEKHPVQETKMIFKIKSTVVSILLSLDSYQENEKKLYCHYDSNLVLRKYKMFRKTAKNGYKKENSEENILHEMARELVNINYYYFDLANSLWKLKELQDSLYRKREIDSTSLELLDVPRVTTEHIYSGEGTINYWKVTADITVELSEQSSEIIHHIYMYVDNLWKEFHLPKYYKTENSTRSIDFRNMTLENLVFKDKEK